MDQPTSKLVLELYKAHYSAKETAKITNYSYQTIVAMYRNYKLMGIKQYDRSNLIPKEILSNAILSA